MTYDSPRDYVGNFVYAGQDGLELILTQEGVVDVKASQYQYYLKDHLGNTRVMFTKVGTKVETLQENHYYPFGMRFARGNFITNDNKYLYNGKELQDDRFEIAGGEFRYLDWYDYGARFYDQTLGRFHTQDAFAEKYLDLSQYQYVADNPILFMDFNGDSIYHFNNDGIFTGEITPDDGLHRGIYNGIEFIFGDQENDHLNLVDPNSFDVSKIEVKKEIWYKVNVESFEQVTERLEEAGAFKERNVLSGIFYALKESDGGEFDYGIKIQMYKQDIGAYTVVETSEGYTSFSDRNYGNFLIGVSHLAVSKGKFGGRATQLLGHMYPLLKRDGYWLDSKDDQHAIKLGADYYWDNYHKMDR